MVQIPRSYAELKQKVPNIGIIFAAIASWFSFSLLISLYNKWMFSDPTLNFKFPVIITACHQFVLFWLSCLTLTFWPKFRLNYVDPSKGISSSENLSYFINPKVYITKILPCALASAGDIGLGNSSLKYITISLYTMLKSSAVLIFTLFWGFLLRLEKVTLKLCLITFIMTGSVMMMVYGQGEPSNETSPSAVEEEAGEMKLRFVRHLMKRAASVYLGVRDDEQQSDALVSGSTLVSSSSVTGATSKASAALDTLTASSIIIGCFLVLLASCMSGLRWALTQIVLRGNRYTKNPILTIFYLSPAMCVSLIIMGSQVEGIGNFLGSQVWETYGILGTCLLLLFPGFLAFCMTLSQFIILQYAPLLTLSIAGIVRELITIFLGWLIFGDHLNAINMLGILITLGDIAWYNLYRLEQSSVKPASAASSEDTERFVAEEHELESIDRRK
ncbi:hypothetical protein KL905_002973 [Ogataea polymorpha]|uniref:GDP-mannose transporter n=1 Tax=Ogataea polymorpha TaxID=460523 RepID=A0A1B7SQT1_9ASCO|nr:uncharacterized protein OGAPODRAFT_74960 [Ogataea polymorpha]KAG7880304.1 hypothetical protein KL937_002531 [Ogataea polymorpha]KAG7900831.1 hypothetical protein KL935_002764 [Ogataea polymorpha]KAG7916608.1 hypothetical protein KL927_003247 [Ogataea polymorpha]KAG7921515.1 hypothetical protein KL905_002973 [Ogataea polymorpha]KAG7933923.1 hypothetical protein KL934_002845 [Ogataea polymorpha]